MLSPATSPGTPPPSRSPNSPSRFPAALHTFPVDAGTTNISAQLPVPTPGPTTPQEKKETTSQQVHRRVRAQFISKLHSIITLPNAGIIRWSSDGRTFTIKNPALFREKYVHTILTPVSRDNFIFIRKCIPGYPAWHRIIY